MEDPLTKRRRFLQSAAVSGTALLAGCSGILDSEESADDKAPEAATQSSQSDEDGGSNEDGGSDEDNGIVPGEGDTRSIGIVSEPDQQAVKKLRQQVQAGELSQSEAIQRQQELIQEALTALKEALQSQTDIEVNEEYGQIGAMKITGDPYELIDSLTSAKASALVSPEQLQSPQQPTG
ncbi:hypothetical protein ACFQJ7_02665 [Halovenus rubra]|uniref:Uncharacterized protein n=2 Tax=Halovenus rubra TaxID=869890 RepID=A0ACC7E262_9EURY|nr:hypothetical protein [Halovenus rubra]